MVKLNLEIPHGFLDEEVRSGYVVTSDMKAILKPFNCEETRELIYFCS